MPSQLICADSVCGLRTLAAGSVHLIVTSPPYDDLYTYGQAQGVQWDFPGTAQEIHRVLCAGGICCWNVADETVAGSETLTSFRQALHFKDVLGFNVETMIYEKTNGSKPNAYRYDNLFEYVFVFSKGKPRVVNLIKDKPNKTAGKTCYGVKTMRQRNGEFEVQKKRQPAAEFGSRGNVWRGLTRGQEEICQKLPRPAMMPQWLARDLIRSFSNPGDLVCDPFGGSGTTVVQAYKLGRQYCAIDVDPAAVQLMQAELHAAKLPLFES